MTTSRRTKAVTSDVRRMTSGAFDVAVCELMAAGGVPNKPMVPTAPTTPFVNPPCPLRRHIGQPLESLESSGRRPTKSRNRAAIDEETSVPQRTTGLG